MRISVCLMVITILMLASIPASHSRSTVVLATDYPYASIFLSMARRGAADYGSQYNSLPSGIEQMVAEGYTAYRFPAGFQPDYNVAGDQLEITSNGHSEYTMGGISDPGLYGVTLSNGALYELMELYILPTGSADEEHELRQVKAYLFKGAEWYDAGHSSSMVIEAQRYDRVMTHLVNATLQYCAANSWMPSDLDELEGFVGVERNPVGWEGINIVWSQDEVDCQTGNLFVDWSGSEWITDHPLTVKNESPGGLPPGLFASPPVLDRKPSRRGSHPCSPARARRQRGMVQPD